MCSIGQWILRAFILNVSQHTIPPGCNYPTDARGCFLFGHDVSIYKHQLIISVFIYFETF